MSISHWDVATLGRECYLGWGRDSWGCYGYDMTTSLRDSQTVPCLLFSAGEWVWHSVFSGNIRIGKFCFALRRNSFWTWASWWVVVPFTKKFKGKRWQDLWNKSSKNVEEGGEGYQVISTAVLYSSSVSCSRRVACRDFSPSFLPAFWCPFTSLGP